MNKEVKKIFLVLAFYALSGGVFYNFQELWMADNNLSTQTIGMVFSLCALLTVSTIFLCSNLITKDKLKKFSLILILLKVIILASLFFLYNSGFNAVIKFLIMVDYVIDVEIYACIYPMITFITQNNKVYALRGLIYSYAYYAGVLITSFLLGKVVLTLNINFNTYCLLGSILMLIAFVILLFTNLEQYNVKEDKKDSYDALYKVLKKIKTDKISQAYLGYAAAGSISSTCIKGLLITLLTVNLNFSASAASNFNLILGILSVLIATFILQKFTFKNNYINLIFKYGVRIILYILAVIFNNKLLFIIAIVYFLALTESYTHVTDAPYVNRFKTEDQLAFCNLKEMVGYFTKAIGSLICGIALTYSVRYNFAFAALFSIIQLIFGIYALKLYNRESVLNDRK